MQPSANMKPRAEWHQSAPSSIVRATSKAVMTLPLAPSRTRSRRLSPTRVLCTSSSASCSGVPMWSANSIGAAPVPPSPPSTTMKSGVTPVSSIALQMPKNSHGCPSENLKPIGLPPESSRSRPMKSRSSSGVSDADRHAARLGDLRGHLGARQHAAVAGLGALRDLDLDHLDLGGARLLGELFRIELAVRRAAAEIAAADLPDQVAAVLAGIAADPALAGVVGEAAELGALVERAHRVRRERAEAHRRNVEHGAGIRLLALVAADHHSGVGVCDVHRAQRMIDPFVAGEIHVLAGAERLAVLDALGALVDQRALRARERHRLVVALQEILADLRPDRLEEEADVRHDRVVAQDRTARLQEIADADRADEPGGAGEQEPAPIAQRRRERDQRDDDRR